MCWLGRGKSETCWNNSCCKLCSSGWFSVSRDSPALSSSSCLGTAPAWQLQNSGQFREQEVSLELLGTPALPSLQRRAALSKVRTLLEPGSAGGSTQSHLERFVKDYWNFWITTFILFHRTELQHLICCYCINEMSEGSLKAQFLCGGTLSRKDFSKLRVFLSNVACRLEIASSIELHNEKSISLMVDKLWHSNKNVAGIFIKTCRHD